MSGAAPPLPRRLKFAFSVGSTAEALLISVTSQFTLLFYNQVLGLPAGPVGIALSLGLFANAFFDPMIGSWSDRTRSRLGRRHPFMFASIVPVALTFWAIFNPPAQFGQTFQLVWLALSCIFFQQALTIFHTPHLAFGGELSESYIERSQVMSWNTFFFWAGDSAAWLLTFALFFRSSAKFPNGALDPTRWPPLSITVALAVPAMLFASTWFTRSRIPWLPQADPGAPRFSMLEFFRDVGRALGNRNYMMLLIGFFFNAMMSGVRNGLWLYTATFFWRLKTDQLSWFVIGSFVSYVIGSLVVAPLHRRFDKRWTGMGAALGLAVGPALPLALGWLGWLSADTPFILPILIAFAVLQHIPYSLLTTTVYSALADIADENELRFGIRQEGILYSTRTFFARVDQAIGGALAGWVLTIIAFPAKATPGHVPQGVLMALAAAFVISTVGGLLAALFYGMINVTKRSHDACQAALAERRAETAAAAAV